MELEVICGKNGVPEVFFAAKICIWNKTLYLCRTFEANHNKDYSVVKTFRSSVHRPLTVDFFFSLVAKIHTFLDAALK
jgi:hypothetical protein